MRLTLPLPPNLANDRMHWRKRIRAKAAYSERAWIWHLSDGDGAAIPERPLERARIAATLYTWSEMDTDNLFARLKWAQDWLVEAGFILDDSPKVLEWVGMPEQEVDRSNRRVEITLEAM